MVDLSSGHSKRERRKRTAENEPGDFRRPAGDFTAIFGLATFSQREAMRPRTQAQGGNAGHSFARIYSSCATCNSFGLRWLLPPKAWGCLNVFTHGKHARTHSSLQEKSGAW